jgi:hypothetical protein
MAADMSLRLLRLFSLGQHPQSSLFVRYPWRATADEDGHYCFAVAL